MRLTTDSPGTTAYVRPTVSWSDLQNVYTAPENTYAVVVCPDGPTGASQVFSDGVVWRLFAKGEQLMYKMADASGVATFTFSPSFSAAPLVFVEVYDTSTDNLAVTYKLTAKSTTGCTVKVRRQQLLPSTLTLLTALTNFDVFGGTNLTAIQVSILVKPPPAIAA